MSLDEYIKNYKKLNIKNRTKYFNELTVNEGKVFLGELSESEKTVFIKVIRKQAVADFWTHERELIEQGQSTRDWTPEQEQRGLDIIAAL